MVDVVAPSVASGLEDGSHGHTVWLHIYDFDSWTAHLNKVVLKAVRLGAFHVGVEVFGLEWFAAWSDSSGSGVMSHAPKEHGEHIYRESIYMGLSPLTEAEIQCSLGKIMLDWPGNSYHPLHRNSAIFAEELVLALRVPVAFPTWVRGATTVASSAALSPLGEFAWSRVKQQARKEELGNFESHKDKSNKSKLWSRPMRKVQLAVSSVPRSAEQINKDNWMQQFAVMKAKAQVQFQRGSEAVARMKAKALAFETALSQGTTSGRLARDTSRCQSDDETTDRPFQGATGSCHAVPVKGFEWAGGMREGASASEPPSTNRERVTDFVSTVAADESHIPVDCVKTCSCTAKTMMRTTGPTSANLHVAEARQWSILIDRSSGELLGIDVECDVEVGQVIDITFVRPGLLVDQWNRTHPTQSVQAGDCICEVNGTRDVHAMLLECQSLQQLQISIQPHGLPRNTPFLEPCSEGYDSEEVLFERRTPSASSTRSSSSSRVDLSPERGAQKSNTNLVPLKLDALSLRSMDCELDVQTIPMSARDAATDGLSLFESTHWEWPLSRSEKKARVNLIERNLCFMEHCDLLRENANLREKCSDTG